jgi:hypothetical protein
MNWLSKLFGAGIGEVTDGLDKIFARFKMAPEEAHKHRREVLTMLLTTFSKMEESVQSEIRAKENIIVAELKQGDAFTKRARPWIVYSGLILAGLEVVARYAAWITGAELPTVDGQYVTSLAPAEFWIGWGAVVSIYSIGRTAEKRGMQNKLLGMITGGAEKKRSLFD